MPPVLISCTERMLLIAAGKQMRRHLGRDSKIDSSVGMLKPSLHAWFGFLVVAGLARIEDCRGQGNLQHAQLAALAAFKWPCIYFQTGNSRSSINTLLTLCSSCPPPSQVMTAGVMAGFGLWGSMFPIDTIKSKIQADSLSKPQFKGTIDCIQRSVQIEGYGGLWRGVTAALWRAIPVNAAIFLAVEGTRQLIADSEETVDAFVANISGQQQEAAL